MIEPALTTTPATVGHDAVEMADEFSVVYDHHYRRLVVALRLSGASLATAEEITQEAFVRAFTSWRRIRTGTNPPGYLYRTAFRLWQRRRRAELDPQPFPAVPPADPSAENEITTRLTIDAALASLPLRARACAVLALQSGLDTHEIAHILSIQPATVRVHIHHARTVLHSALTASSIT